MFIRWLNIRDAEFRLFPQELAAKGGPAAAATHNDNIEFAFRRNCHGWSLVKNICCSAQCTRWHARGDELDGAA